MAETFYRLTTFIDDLKKAIKKRQQARRWTFDPSLHPTTFPARQAKVAIYCSPPGLPK